MSDQALVIPLSPEVYRPTTPRERASLQFLAEAAAKQEAYAERRRQATTYILSQAERDAARASARANAAAPTAANDSSLRLQQSERRTSRATL